MKTIKKNLILLLVLIAALAITKPSEASFSEWLSERYDAKTEQASGENGFDKLINKGKLKITQGQIAATAEYENKYLFAMVKSQANSENIQFLGIFGIWMKIS